MTSDDRPAAPASGRKRWLVRGGVAAAVVIVTAAVFLPKFLFSLSHESTDDAYVDGTIVPVSAEVPGKVVRVMVDDHERVTRGRPLVEIDPVDFQSTVSEKDAALAQARARISLTRARIDQGEKDLAAARARLESARAKAALAEKELGRSHDLLVGGAVSQSDYDAAETAFELAAADTVSARAEVEAAAAGLRSQEAELDAEVNAQKSAELALSTADRNLGRTTVTAPLSGVVAKRNVDPGKYVTVGQPLMALVDEDSVWVTANFKETQIHKIREGMPVTLDVDAYPGTTFHGRVQSLQPGTGAVFSLLPPENATGNFIKVTQRVPVRITVVGDPGTGHPLWPGLSVNVHVDVSEKAPESTHGG
jgi:membrane fusion protein (multidrug efflux system)